MLAIICKIFFSTITCQTKQLYSVGTMSSNERYVDRRRDGEYLCSYNSYVLLIRVYDFFMFKHQPAIIRLQVKCLPNQVPFIHPFNNLMMPLSSFITIVILIFGKQSMWDFDYIFIKSHTFIINIFVSQKLKAQ